jgi:aldose 1-epimerase
LSGGSDLRRNTPAPPSGEQLEISFGDQRAVVVEVGGGLRTYSVADRVVLDGYGADEQPQSGRGQLLIPWPNRLADGSYEFDGQRHQLPLTEPEGSNAIHGLVRGVAWTVGERDPDRIVMQHVIRPQPGYPFTLALDVEYSLGLAGLSVQTTARNLGAEACPYGCGQHPYLTVGTATVDSNELRAPGAEVLVSDERGIPTGSESVEGTEFDFRVARTIGTTKLDNAFTNLERDEDGRARVGLRDADGGRAITLWMDESYRYVMLFTGDTRPDVDRRSLAVEPMTCPPNAFRTGESVIRLEPEQSITTVWGITPS